MLSNNFTVLDGSTRSFSLGRFTDANSDGDLTEYLSQIAWGDGQTSQGTIVANLDGSFSLLANHAYANAGNFTLCAFISNPRDGEETTANIRVQVNDQTTTVYWTGAQNNHWFNAGNWSSGRIPSAQDDVVIEAAGVNIVADVVGDGGQAIQINSLDLASGTLTLANGTALTVAAGNATATAGLLQVQLEATLVVNGTLSTPNFDLNCGTLDGSGTLSVSGTFNLNGGTLQGRSATTVSGTLNLTKSFTLDGATLSNAGNAFWTGGAITSQNLGRFINAGVFTNQGGTGWTSDGSTLVQNNGVFIQDSPVTTELAVVLNVNGTVLNQPFNVNS